jgi:hypothetical protein
MSTWAGIGAGLGFGEGVAMPEEEPVTYDLATIGNMLSQVLGRLNELEVKIDDAVHVAGEARDNTALTRTELDTHITTSDTRDAYYTRELTGAHNAVTQLHTMLQTLTGAQGQPIGPVQPPQPTQPIQPAQPIALGGGTTIKLAKTRQI